MKILETLNMHSLFKEQYIPLGETIQNSFFFFSELCPFFNSDLFTLYQTPHSLALAPACGVFVFKFQVLVCENTGQLALLEPLTIHTACISLLSKRNSLSLEKVLLQSREEMLGKLESDSTGKTSVDHLVNKLLAGKKYKADNGKKLTCFYHL